MECLVVSLLINGVTMSKNRLCLKRHSWHADIMIVIGSQNELLQKHHCGDDALGDSNDQPGLAVLFGRTDLDFPGLSIGKSISRIDHASSRLHGRQRT